MPTPYNPSRTYNDAVSFDAGVSYDGVPYNAPISYNGAIAGGYNSEIPYNDPRLYNGGVLPDARSGINRLQLYALQEYSLKRDEERRKEAVAEAVEKVLKPTVKGVKKRTTAPKVTKTVAPAEKPPFKQLPAYSAPVQDNLPFLQEMWAIISITTIELGLSRLSLQQLASAVEDAANDEEDIELLLLAA